MTRHTPIPAARSPVSGNLAGTVKSMSPAVPATFSACPDCDGPFSYRIRDEDTGCSYPVDDGEHYCDACDALWTDECLREASIAAVTTPFMTTEEALDRIARVFLGVGA